MDCAIEPGLMNFYDQNWKIWMWTMFICNNVHVKDKVYADAPQSIQELKEKIRAVIDKIEHQMYENVMENFMKRAWSCKLSHRGHMNDIIFHY